MRYIEVKTKPGRIARTSKNGDMIPEDRYIRVPFTPYIKRLLDYHGDIEQRPQTTKKATATPAPVAERQADPSTSKTQTAKKEDS